MRRFSPATFRFLRDLAQHNDTTWFHDHRDDYDRHVRAPAFDLAAAWAEALPETYRPGSAAEAVWRPNRDIRFSPDRRPYRENLAIRMRHRLALAGPGPSFLLWVAPGGSFLEAGVPRVAGKVRERVLQAILAEPEAWRRARHGLDLSDQDRFLRAPPGPEDLQEDLRTRHFTVRVPLSQRSLCAPDLSRRLVQASQRLLPLNGFLASALYGRMPGV